VKKKNTSSKSLLLVSGDNELKRQITDVLGLARLPLTTLTTVTCGQDALKVLARERPHLVILDDDLPDSTGLDLLRSLCQDGIKTMVVYMAACHALELEKEVRQLGVLYYTEKPPDPAAIKIIIEKNCTSRGD
jgi:DNA-binding response OmpR family regulator